MNTPTEPSALYVKDTGYLAVIGWSAKLVPTLDRGLCVRFTHENLSSLRRDDFHVNLLKTVRETYEDSILSWEPFPP
jgi:hypothetical protein